MNATTKAALAETTTLSAPDPSLLDQIMSRMETAIERRVMPTVQPMELRSFEELERWAERAARSGMVPKDYVGKPDAIIIAVQMGSELGLRPMQSLANIAVVNGRATVWGDAILALCKTHPAYVSTQEVWTGEGDTRQATCTMIRRGEPPVVRTFGVAEARKAGLWGKGGPWTQYPDRMMQMRARGFAARDAFPDKLRGLISAEEAADYPTLNDAGITPRHEPVSAAPAAAPLPPAARFYRSVAELDAACAADNRQRTAAEWVSAICAELNAAPDAAAVDALHARADVRKGVEALKNGNLAKLTEALATARARFEALDDPDAERGEYGLPEAAE